MRSRGSDPVNEAARAARRGELIVMPTDTVYGIGTRPDDPRATARVFRAKRRSRDLQLPVLIASIAEAQRIGVFDRRALAMASSWWPGSLTLVIPRKQDALDWDLGSGDAEPTVGLRVPAHPLAAAVLRASGPLAMTSANVSGAPPARTCDALREAFGEAVAIYLCEDEPLVGAASTVLDLAHGKARIVREGAISAEAIARSMPPGEPLIDSRPSP